MQFFEEIGWRGFLLPHIQEKYNAWASSAILAVIWAGWHIPFFFYRFNFSIGISIGFFFAIFIASVILTSIFNSSGGGVISVILFHFLNNLFSAFEEELILTVLSSGYMLIAFYIYRKYGKINLSNSNRMKNYFCDMN